MKKIMAVALALFVFAAFGFIAACKKAEEPKAPAEPAEEAPAEEIPAPTSSQSPISAIDRILESMEWGNIVFNIPSSMNMRDSAEIKLLLSLEKSIEDLRRTVTEAGVKEGAHIRVSNQMEAHLTGQNFQITAITPEEQAITSRGVTEWRWEVKPTTLGSHPLHLTLTAIFSVDGKATRRAIRTFDKTIEVRITWGQQASKFIGNNWQWLWAAILVPLAGWLWKNRKSRKARKK